MHSGRSGSKRCISKAHSVPGIETRETYNVETEGWAGGRRADGSYFYKEAAKKVVGGVCNRQGCSGATGWNIVWKSCGEKMSVWVENLDHYSGKKDILWDNRKSVPPISKHQTPRIRSASFKSGNSFQMTENELWAGLSRKKTLLVHMFSKSKVGYDFR